MHGQEKRAEVRDYIVELGLSQQQAADKAGVHVGTVRNWMRTSKAEGDDWITVKNATQLAKGGVGALNDEVLERFCRQFAVLMNDVEQDPSLTPLERSTIFTRLSDSYSKVLAAVSRHSPKHNRLAMALEVLKLQADFVRKEHPQVAPVLLETLQPFGQYLSKHYAAE